MGGTSEDMRAQPTIDVCGVSHRYTFSNRRIQSLRDVCLQVQPGEFVAIIGRNGCGKSTLAKHFNMLVPLQEGNLTIAGLDASRDELAWEVRRACGMVFQNPDNQFVSTIVEEDLDFGLQNFGVAVEQRKERISRALEQVDMSGVERCNPHFLSGGQKQRVALAGILAVRPDIIVLDEATTMLPPEGRAEVLRVVGELHKTESTTIVMITHYIDETARADRIVVMDAGSVVGQGSPREILSDVGLLQDAGLEPPFAVRLYHDLLSRGVQLDHCPLSVEEAEEQLCQLNSRM